MDKGRGNLVKPDRFGYIKRAMHGTKMLSTRAVRYGANLQMVKLLNTCCFTMENLEVIFFLMLADLLLTIEVRSMGGNWLICERKADGSSLTHFSLFQKL